MRSTATYEMHNYAATATPHARSESTSPLSTRLQPAKGKQSERGEKYSLRRRQKRKWAQSGGDAEDPADTTLSESDQQPLPAGGHISRSGPTQKKRSKPNSSRARGTAGADKSAAAAAAKAKVKAPPLSKYRRKTANARERSRMREINSAFENLRHRVPQAITGEPTACSNEKLTKITTLRLAMKYIRILSEALTNPGCDLDFLWDSPASSPTHEPAVAASRGELATARRREVSPPAKQTKKPGKSKNGKTPASVSASVNKSTRSVPGGGSAASASKHQKKRRQRGTAANTVATPKGHIGPVTVPAHGRPSRPRQRTNAVTIANAVSVAAHSEMSQSLSDLSTLMLESDGESLHLSENCLSPLQSRAFDRLLGSVAQAKLLPSATDSSLSLSLSSSLSSSSAATDNLPFELALSLLDSTDSTVDSLDLVADQAPPVCLSPLMGAPYEAFNPFGDLLHADFADHNPLDLFSA